MWANEAYMSSSTPTLWHRLLPHQPEKGFLQEFDEVIVHPKWISTLEISANPMWRYKRGYFENLEFLISQLHEFQGKISTLVVDWRPRYVELLKRDWSKYANYQLSRTTHNFSEETTWMMVDLTKRIEVVAMNDDISRYSASWICDNLLGDDFIEKDLDFIFGGSSEWRNLSKCRQSQILRTLETFPNSASMGNTRVPGTPSLSSRFFEDYFSVASSLNRAKYQLLTWEPWHHEINYHFTPRVMFALASNSYSFVLPEVLDVWPECPFPVHSLEGLPEPTDVMIDKQHTLLLNFSL